MENILKRFAESEQYQEITSGLEQNLNELLVTGLTGSAKNTLIAALYKNELIKSERSVVLLTHNLVQAERIQDDIAEILGEESVLIFPDDDLVHREVLAASTELLEQRMRAMVSMATGRKGIYVIPFAAARRHLVTRTEFISSLTELRVGEEIDLEKLLFRLVEQGYERTDMVGRKGEFSLRGGILDIYPLTEEQPVRVELYDVEIESIRSFAIENQRSITNMQQVLITPVAEAEVIDSEASILDYVSDDTLLILDEPKRIQDSARQLHEIEDGKRSYVSYEHLVRQNRKQMISFTLFVSKLAYSNPNKIINFIAHEVQNYYGQTQLVADELFRWQKAGFDVFFLASDPERAKRIERLLTEVVGEEEKIPGIVKGNLQNGFIISEINLVVVTEGELFSRQLRKLRRSDKTAVTDQMRSYSELKPDDYVVHVSHGIGIYKGVVTREFAGTHKDYLHLKYAKDDALFVPTDQLGLVQKYEGGEGNRPKIYTLSGGDWKRVKSRVKASVMDIAEDLIKLYALREATEGFAFPADTEYHREFAAMFPYQETPDQQRVIAEIAEDMERKRPMDRLLCGDVGYGKTEVAIRAAFKAVYGGKQVAFLVPTTILAQQQYNTFIERFQDYPIKIAVISRFTKRGEQTRILKQLADGTVDIIIGTHRLLSKDIKFNDIGLIIVDEEQKFGVKHKEAIKALRANIDVLTLTATPIPRTLHMSMVGIRDLSIIDTPPENRYPVQTYVMEYSEALVKEAIERELARGGQVYFLHNRVHSIERFAMRIRSLLPEARVAVAHGQLDENELEAIMLNFLAGDYDVLVTTTIIESGVDIPNVNTLIVSDADKMGLSQLYQLRGRVGRSNRIAYAYFTYQRDKVLTEIAEKRLVTIKEFTELGSGFKIAMRDLAIRGAGNLLGAEQSGYINTVGFELYNQLLQEAVSEIKEGSAPKAEVEPLIDLPIDAYLPETFIGDQMQKIEMYKKFANLRELEAANELEAELIDRFGRLPEAVQNLLAIARIKTYLYRYEVESMTQQEKEVIIKVSANQNSFIDGAKLFIVANNFERPVKLSSHGQLRIRLNNNGLKAKETLRMLENFLEKYDGILNKKGL
jgi:transcription-repair coupling factor (superfamily II helicase)